MVCGVLLLDIFGVIVDKLFINYCLGVLGCQLFGVSFDCLQENFLFDIVNVICQVKDDCNIMGIVLDLKNFIGVD